MKFVLLFLAILGATNASGYAKGWRVLEVNEIVPRNLNDLLMQFAAFIPLDKCEEIVLKYIQNDPDVQEAFQFMQSDEFADLANKVENMPEYKKSLKYLYDAGLDIYTYRNIIRGFFGLPPIDNPPPKFAYRFGAEESGIIKMVRELLSVLPIDDIRDWYDTVCFPNPEFQDFLAKIRSQEFKDLVSEITASKEYQDLINILQSQGIDVDLIQKIISDFLNGTYLRVHKHGSARTLRSLVDQFKALLPLSDIEGIIIKYYLFNADFKRVVNYLKGDEFRQLVIKIEGLQQFKDFLAYLADHQLDVYNTLNKLLDLLGLPEVNPKHVINRIHPRPRSGLTDMIDEIYALLPIDDIVAWYKSTCEPDPEFQDLLAQLRGDDFKVVVQAFSDDPAHTTIHNGLMSLDIDVAAVDAFLNNFFGWNLS